MADGTSFLRSLLPVSGKPVHVWLRSRAADLQAFADLRGFLR
jgi:hypothetical protein